MDYKKEFEFLRMYLTALSFSEVGDNEVSLLRNMLEQIVCSFLGKEPLGEQLYYYAKMVSMLVHAINRYTHGS